MFIYNPMEAVDMLCGVFPRPVSIPFHLEQHLTARLFAWFEKLLQSSEWKSWQFGEDDGIQRRDPSPAHPTRDPKWLFHFKQHVPDLLETYRVNIRKHFQFLIDCEHALFQIITDAAPYITAMDTILPGFAFLRNFQEGVHTLRLIIDDPPAITGNNVVADTHTDLSFCTYHLWESRPEMLYYDEGSDTWVSAPDQSVDHDHTTFFLGRKAAIMTGGTRVYDSNGNQTLEVNGGILRPLRHMVRERGNVALLTTPRKAIVAFLHVPLVL